MISSSERGRRTRTAEQGRIADAIADMSSGLKQSDTIVDGCITIGGISDEM